MLAASVGSVVAAASDLSVCFREDTLISTEQGMVPIRDIQAGALVWATNEATGETALKEVARLFRHETDEWIHLAGETFDAGDHTVKVQVDANNGTTARNGVIRLTSGGISTDILVRQGTEKE